MQKCILNYGDNFCQSLAPMLPLWVILHWQLNETLAENILVESTLARRPGVPQFKSFLVQVVLQILQFFVNQCLEISNTKKCSRSKIWLISTRDTSVNCLKNEAIGQYKLKNNQYNLLQRTIGYTNTHSVHLRIKCK